MKHVPPFLLLTVLVLCLTLSCQELPKGDRDTADSLIQRIADDPDYDSFWKIAEERAYMAARGDYITEQLGELLRKHPEKSSCDIPKEEFSKIPGGEVFQDLDCSMVTVQRKLEAKYKFSEMTNGLLEQIKDYYYSKRPERREALKERIFQQKISKQ